MSHLVIYIYCIVSNGRSGIKGLYCTKIKCTGIYTVCCHPEHALKVKAEAFMLLHLPWLDGSDF